MICFCRGYGLCPTCDSHTCTSCQCDDIDQTKETSR